VIMNEISLPHMLPGCPCSSTGYWARAEECQIDGREVLVRMPECQLPQRGSSGPIREMMHHLAIHLRRRIIRERDVWDLAKHYDVPGREYPGPWVIKDIIGLRPYCFLRDAVRFFAPHGRQACSTCGRRFAGAPWTWDTNNGSPLLQCPQLKWLNGTRRLFCSKVCFELFYNSYLAKEKTWRETEERARRGLAAQLKAVRKFLKEGSPAAFDSLPPGFGPAPTSSR
jgi:hypothetical protein